MSDNKNILPPGTEWCCVEPNGSRTTVYPTREDCVNAGGRVEETAGADSAAGRVAERLNAPVLKTGEP